MGSLQQDGLPFMEQLRDQQNGTFKEYTPVTNFLGEYVSKLEEQHGKQQGNGSGNGEFCTSFCNLNTQSHQETLMIHILKIS